MCVAKSPACIQHKSATGMAAPCPSGYKLLSGGCDNATTPISNSGTVDPSTAGWHCDTNAQAYAICGRLQ